MTQNFATRRTIRATTLLVATSSTVPTAILQVQLYYKQEPEGIKLSLLASSGTRRRRPQALLHLNKATRRARERLQISGLLHHSLCLLEVRLLHPQSPLTVTALIRPWRD